MRSLSYTVTMHLSLPLTVNDRFSWKRRLLSELDVSAAEQNRSGGGCVRLLIQSPCICLSLPMIDPGNGRDESAKANFVCRMIPQLFSDDVTPIVSFPLLSLHSCIRARQQ